MIKLMDKENIHIQMELHITDIGKKINSMGKERSIGLMVQTTQEITKMEKNKDMASLNGLINLPTKVILKLTIFKVKVSIHGLMGENIVETG